MMRWLAFLSVLLVACPPPAQYTVVRPELSCDRAVRVAHKTLGALGYTITELAEPSVERSGAVGGTKVDAQGQAHKARVIIRCSGQGAVLQPVEEGLVPSDYEFSRTFGYSFTTLVQRPDVEQPWQNVGLQVLVQTLDPFKARLDLGDVPTVGEVVVVRVTVRNNTDRKVRLDASRLSLVDAQGNAHEPLLGGALVATLAKNNAGDRLRAEAFGPTPIAARETRVGFLVYPLARYREARVAIEDVETEETDGFVMPVE